MTRKAHRLRFCFRRGCCLLLAAHPLSAMGDESLYRYFDLPGQTLQSGLVELALQANVTVVANHQLLRGHQSASIIGLHTPEQALKKILARTPLDYAYNETTNSFVILPREITPDLKPTTAATETEGAARVEEVVVYAPAYPFRYNTLANTQLNEGAADYDSSRFHTVLPARLIEDLMPLEIDDLLKNGSGISPADGRADTNDDFYMRGFPRHALYVDGFRVENTTGARFLPDNVERVEILKGPSTIRYGQGEPGGMVNLVRKKPLDQPAAQVQLSLGDNGLRKVATDVSDKLVSEEFRYRINAVDFRRENSADIYDLQQQMLAPSLRWRPSTAADLSLGYEVQQTRQRTAEDFDVLLPYLEEDFPGATFGQFVLRANPGFRADRHLLHINGEHYFTEQNMQSGWRIKANIVWQEEDRSGVRGTSDHLGYGLLFNPSEIPNLYLLLIPGGQVAIPVTYRVNPNDPSDPLLSIGTVRSVYDEQSSETGLQRKLVLDGTLTLGGFKNHVNTGIDWHRQDLFQSYTIESRRPLPFQSWPESETPSLNYFINAIFAPNRPLGELRSFEYRQVSDEYGFYFQNTIELNESLSLTGGARWSRIEVNREMLTDQHNKDFSPVEKIRLQSGLNYQLNDELQLFANYAQGLRSNHNKGGFGEAISEPELSDQWETGIKGYFFEGRLSAGIAGYRINKTNIYWIDNVSINAFSFEEYGQKVLGMDLDFTFELSHSTQVMGSFSAQDNQLTYGPYTNNVPAASTPNTASVFWRHELSNSFSVNLGGNYVGHRYADHANNFKIDSFFIFDTGAQYTTTFSGVPLSFQIKVKNLLDREYYSDVVAGIRLNEGERRQLVAGVRLDLR